MIVCGLIKGRHRLPDDVSTYIFPSDVPQDHICDAAYMENVCSAFCDKHKPDKIVVYVTGFTPALLALIRVCVARGIKLDAYNYNRETRSFWMQEVM